MEIFSQELKGKAVLVDVDSQSLYSIFMKGGSSREAFITDVCKKLFWLQVKGQFSLSLQWVPSAENESDGLTREDVNNDVRLSGSVFRRIDARYGPLQSDLMASSANV